MSDHSCGQYMLPQRLPVQPQKNPPNKNLLVPSLPWRHACLTTPVVKPPPPQQPSKQTAITPPTKPQKQKAHQPSSRLSSGATAPNERSRTCERILQTKNLLVPSLLRRHACLTTPVVNTCSRNGSQSNRKRIPQNKNLLVLPLPRRHAWLAAPAANTCPRNGPQNKRQ